MRRDDGEVAQSSGPERRAAPHRIGGGNSCFPPRAFIEHKATLHPFTVILSNVSQQQEHAKQPSSGGRASCGTGPAPIRSAAGNCGRLDAAAASSFHTCPALDDTIRSVERCQTDLQASSAPSANVNRDAHGAGAAARPPVQSPGTHGAGGRERPVRRTRCHGRAVPPPSPPPLLLLHHLPALLLPAHPVLLPTRSPPCRSKMYRCSRYPKNHCNVCCPLEVALVPLRPSSVTPHTAAPRQQQMQLQQRLCSTASMRGVGSPISPVPGVHYAAERGLVRALCCRCHPALLKLQLRQKHCPPSIVLCRQQQRGSRRRGGQDSQPGAPPATPARWAARACLPCAPVRACTRPGAVAVLQAMQVTLQCHTLQLHAACTA